MSKEMKMRILPWMLIFGGIVLLNNIPAIIGGGCLVVGITMLIERRWLEQWGTDINNKMN